MNEERRICPNPKTLKINRERKKERERGNKALNEEMYCSISTLWHPLLRDESAHEAEGEVPWGQQEETLSIEREPGNKEKQVKENEDNGDSSKRKELQEERKGVRQSGNQESARGSRHRVSADLSATQE